MPKTRIGLFSFSSCEGCFMELLNHYSQHMQELDAKIEVVAARVLREKNELENLDVALVEGAIATRKDAEKLKKIRRNSKLLVCFGSCAMEGWPSTQRNKFPDSMQRELIPKIGFFGQMERIMLPSDFVKVDASFPGCPIMLPKFLGFLDSLGGK